MRSRSRGVDFARVQNCRRKRSCNFELHGRSITRSEHEVTSRKSAQTHSLPSSHTMDDQDDVWDSRVPVWRGLSLSDPVKAVEVGPSPVVSIHVDK